MENDDAQDSQRKASENLQPGAPETKTGKKQGKASSAANKSGKHQKWTLYRHWQAANKGKRVKWCVEGIVVITGILILFVYIWGNIQTERTFRMDHRARVVFSRPPELLGTIECEITDQEMHIHTGPMHVWVKNTKQGDASGAYIVGPTLRFVPDKKFGIPSLDDPPPPPIFENTCSEGPMPDTKQFPVNGGQEIGVDIRQSAATWHFAGATKTATVTFEDVPPQGEVSKGPLPKDARFLISVPVCVYYADDIGGKHGTCATYRLTNKTDGLFSCTESPFSGILEQTLFAYCQN